MVCRTPCALGVKRPRIKSTDVAEYPRPVQTEYHASQQLANRNDVADCAEMRTGSGASAKLCTLRWIQIAHLRSARSRIPGVWGPHLILVILQRLRRLWSLPGGQRQQRRLDPDPRAAGRQRIRI